MKDYNFKASELFTGALVLLDGKEIKVASASDPWIFYYQDTCQLDDIDPILISVEILERAGFDHEVEVDRYFIQDDSYMIEKTKGNWILHKWGELENELGTITHFHELQARIFWDSGKEILLTLEK